jgi:S-adenosylmethionine hydrolase
LITLTSDFGLKDPYVAEMKGVILSINPNATIVDVTHDIEKFNILMAAATLANVVSYFPKGTVHLAVVDPGVGTERRAILVQTKLGFFIGPDNGILMLAAQSQSIVHTFEISNPNLMLHKTSNTFHGRDIFAPAAAHIDKGTEPQEFGPEIDNPVSCLFPAVKRTSSILTGEVLYIDGFGNIVTNFQEKDMPNSQTLNMKLSNVALKLKLGKTYAEAEPKKPIVLIGSHGFIEVALNQDNAAKKLNVKVGDKIIVMST